MQKDTPEVITECWQLLVEYIPHRDRATAAEHLFGYLGSVLSKEEQEAISDLDGADLSDAYFANLDEENSDKYREEDE
jgi:hypothetical protein